MHPFFKGMAAIGCAASFTLGAARAQHLPGGWQAGAVVDVSATSREMALGARDKGLGLGHSDLTLSGPLGSHAEAQFTAALHTHDRKLRGELEEAWVQTRSLPAGLQLRAGRFASQLGYLHEQHPHADDFLQRPLLYRAFLGGHWNDDGLRLNWTAPTDLYLRLGAEVFRGRRLVRDAASRRRPGAWVLSSRVGGDIGASQGWQAGLSLLGNRREAAVHLHEGEEHEGEEEHESHEEGGHAHAHGAAFSGRRTRVVDVAWKWSPQGNNRSQQLRLAFEHARVERPNRFAAGGETHAASYLSAVWRFAPAWEIGARADRLRVSMPHGDHFHRASLREHALMLAYKPTHAQTVRLQFTRQRDRGGFDEATHAVQLQYILNLGAHAAHTF